MSDELKMYTTNPVFHSAGYESRRLFIHLYIFGFSFVNMGVCDCVGVDLWKIDLILN